MGVSWNQYGLNQLHNMFHIIGSLRRKKYFPSFQPAFIVLDYSTFNLTETFGTVERNDSTQQCLSVGVTIKSEEGYNFKWKAVKCNQPQRVLCEVTLRTITYAWVPNWMALCLVVLTIGTLLSLCVAAMCLTSRPPKTHEEKRKQSSENDLPPKYKDVVITDSRGTFDKYKNKGKEFFAKIYYVRE